nr:hypothetical protein CFP56_46758 [Quercus suber]
MRSCGKPFRMDDLISLLSDASLFLPCSTGEPKPTREKPKSLSTKLGISLLPSPCRSWLIAAFRCAENKHGETRADLSIVEYGFELRDEDRKLKSCILPERHSGRDMPPSKPASWLVYLRKIPLKRSLSLAKDPLSGRHCKQGSCRCYVHELAWWRQPPLPWPLRQRYKGTSIYTPVDRLTRSLDGDIIMCFASVGSAMGINEVSYPDLFSFPSMAFSSVNAFQAPQLFTAEYFIGSVPVQTLCYHAYRSSICFEHVSGGFLSSYLVHVRKVFMSSVHWVCKLTSTQNFRPRGFMSSPRALNFQPPVAPPSRAIRSTPGINGSTCSSGGILVVRNSTRIDQARRHIRGETLLFCT